MAFQDRTHDSENLISNKKKMGTVESKPSAKPRLDTQFVAQNIDLLSLDACLQWWKYNNNMWSTDVLLPWLHRCSLANTKCAVVHPLSLVHWPEHKNCKCKCDPTSDTKTAIESLVHLVMTFQDRTHYIHFGYSRGLNVDGHAIVLMLKYKPSTTTMCFRPIDTNYVLGWAPLHGAITCIMQAIASKFKEMEPSFRLDSSQLCDTLRDHSLSYNDQMIYTTLPEGHYCGLCVLISLSILIHVAHNTRNDASECEKLKELWAVCEQRHANNHICTEAVVRTTFLVLTLNTTITYRLGVEARRLHMMQLFKPSHPESMDHIFMLYDNTLKSPVVHSAPISQPIGGEESNMFPSVAIPTPNSHTEVFPLSMRSPWYCSYEKLLQPVETNEVIEFVTVQLAMMYWNKFNCTKKLKWVGILLVHMRQRIQKTKIGVEHGVYSLVIVNIDRLRRFAQKAENSTFQSLHGIVYMSEICKCPFLLSYSQHNHSFSVVSTVRAIDTQLLSKGIGVKDSGEVTVHFSQCAIEDWTTALQIVFALVLFVYVHSDADKQLDVSSVLQHSELMALLHRRSVTVLILWYKLRKSTTIPKKRRYNKMSLDPVKRRPTRSRRFLDSS